MTKDDLRVARDADAEIVLLDLDLRHEQRVYIVLPDVPPFAWGIFATLAAGGILAMGNPIAPTDDLRYVLDYIRASVLITTPEVAAATRVAPL